MAGNDALLAASRLAAVLGAVNTLAMAQSVYPTTIYVDDDAPAGGDGSSWGAAFRDLQDALDAAKAQASLAGICVAQGVYTPDRGSLDREKCFVLTSAVSLVGGFAGIRSPYPFEQDAARYVSVLSGDLRRDDGAGFANRSDNSFHVVDATRSDSFALSGFTISGGHADGGTPETSCGGGVFCAFDRWSNLTIYNCRIIDNYARSDGAGVFQHVGVVNLVESLIAENRADALGGARGAAVYAGWEFHADRTRFAGNVGAPAAAASALAAGGMECDVRDSLFDTNDPQRPVIHAGGEVDLLRSTFANNAPGAQASIVIVPGSDIAIEGCIMMSPLRYAPGHEINPPPQGTSVRVAYSLMSGGRESLALPNAQVAWGRGNIDANPQFSNPSGFDRDRETWRDNDYSLVASSPCIDAGALDITAAYVDLMGRERSVNARGACYRRADMGAVEFQRAAPPSAPVQVFVRADAPSGGDGRSWASAFRNLDEALGTPGVREIWLGAGTYSPDAADPYASFYVQCEVTILGGFNGSETHADQRNPALNRSVLSGDLLGNDDAGDASRADNSRSIVRIQRADAVIDGVTIERGRGGTSYRSPGSALDASHSTLTLRDCVVQHCATVGGYWPASAIVANWCDIVLDGSIIRNNRVESDWDVEGGAMQTSSTDLLITGTTFESNSARSPYAEAGALFSQGGDITIVDSAFTGNAVVATIENRYAVARSGAISIRAYDLSIVNSRFVGNEALALGEDGYAAQGVGAIDGHEIVVVNSIFRGNRAAGPQAHVGGISCDAATVAFIGCTIVGNESVGGDGASEGVPAGMYVDAWYTPKTTIANSIFWGNRNASGATLEAQLDVEGVTLSHNCIQGWDASAPGEGEGNIGADPQLLDDLRLAPGSPCINTGNASLLPPDALDLDADGDTSEPIPVDAAGRTRVVRPAVDMGAFEVQCRADYDADAALTTSDLFIFLTDFFAEAPRSDFNADGRVTSSDFFDYIAAFLAGC